MDQSWWSCFSMFFLCFSGFRAYWLSPVHLQCTVDPSAAMSLKLQKRLAASLLGCGKKRVWCGTQHFFTLTRTSRFHIMAICMFHRPMHDLWFMTHPYIYTVYTMNVGNELFHDLKHCVQNPYKLDQIGNATASTAHRHQTCYSFDSIHGPRMDPNETNELSMANSRFNIRLRWQSFAYICLMRSSLTVAVFLSRSSSESVASVHCFWCLNCTCAFLPKRTEMPGWLCDVAPPSKHMTCNNFCEGSWSRMVWLSARPLWCWKVMKGHGISSFPQG